MFYIYKNSYKYLCNIYTLYILQYNIIYIIYTVCVYIFVQTYIHLHTRIYIYIYIYVCVCVRRFMCVGTKIYTHIVYILYIIL